MAGKLFDVVALSLIGGVQHVDASGTKIRGESHLLLVGDPGKIWNSVLFDVYSSMCQLTCYYNRSSWPSMISRQKHTVLTSFLNY